MHLIVILIVSVGLEVAIHYHLQLSDLLLQYLPVVLKLFSGGGAVLTRYLSGG